MSRVLSAAFNYANERASATDRIGGIVGAVVMSVANGRPSCLLINGAFIVSKKPSSILLPIQVNFALPISLMLLLINYK